MPITRKIYKMHNAHGLFCFVLFFPFVAYNWAEVDNWCAKVRSQPITTMNLGDAFKCGVPPNQYAVLADGTQLCVRYRHPHTIMLHGKYL